MRKEVGTPVGRLAPSPTGAQHVGNARTYLLAWLSIRSRQGRLLMRIEDIDSPRVKQWAVQQAIDDLHWLGLDWDEGPDKEGDCAPYLQTDRLTHYEAALGQLRRAERIYPCTCSRRDVAQAASAPHADHEGTVYPGTCAGMRVAEAERLANETFSWRFRCDRQSGTRSFADEHAGEQHANVARDFGDFVIGKADGTPAYQLAVVVDDHAMGVTEVLRGDDLLPSTFRQLELYEFFDWHAPVFAHVPLVVGPDGRRLAKRHGDTRLSTLREKGVTPETLVGLLAWSCGLRPTREPISPQQLLEDFDLTRVAHEPFVLAPQMVQELTP